MDSKAVFRKKVSHCGLLDFMDKFEALGWTTLAESAFSANFQPGCPDETPFATEVIIPLLGDESHPKKASVRRLFFDAFTAMAVEAQHRASQYDDDTKGLQIAKRRKGDADGTSEKRA